MLLALLRDRLSLILLEHPTRGLDIESSIYIWSRLKERCDSGTAIVFVSSDLDEIVQYSDRIFVFYAGRVSPPLDAEKVNVERLGRLIGGKGWGRVRVWSNVGIGILDNPFIRQTQDDVLTWGLAGSWDVTDTITLFGEVQGLWEGSDAPLYGRSNRAFRLGVRYGRGPHWAFDAAVAKTSGAYYGNWQATVGVSYRFHL